MKATYFPSLNLINSVRWPIRKIEIGLVYLLITFATLSFAGLYWASRRSLGWGDEGVYALSARYPDDIMQNVSAVYHYTGFLFRVVNYDLTSFRLLGAALLLFSSVVFWAGCRAFIFSQAKTPLSGRLKWGSLVYFFSGAFLLFYQWNFATPNNYLLTSVAVNLLCGSVLWGFSLAWRGEARSLSATLAFILVGVCVGALIFTKVSSGVCIFLSVALLIPFFPRSSVMLRLAFLVALGVGISIWCAVHFCLVLSISETVDGFRQGWTLFQAFGSHVPSHKLVLYPKEAARLLFPALYIFWPCYLGLGAILVARSFGFGLFKTERSPTMGMFGGIVALAFILSLPASVSLSARWDTNVILPFYLVFHLGWVLLLFAISVVYALSAQYPKAQKDSKSECFAAARRQSASYVCLLLFLVALPLCASVGTANPLFNVTSFYVLPWFAVALILLTVSAFGRAFGPRGLALACMAGISAFSTVQTVGGMIYNPQQVPTILLRQTYATTIGGTENPVLLDEGSHQLVSALADLAREHGFQSGDDIVALSYIPGLVFMLGGRSPGHPTFLSKTKGERAYSAIAIGFADLSRLRSSFVLLNVETAAMTRLLATRGIDFPNDYRKLGSVSFLQSTYSLWKPNFVMSTHGDKDTDPEVMAATPAH